MSSEPGGIASKLGNEYERRFAVELALDLLAGHAKRLRWEPQSGVLGGADIELEIDVGVLEKIQLKRQNGPDARWTVADLASQDVLAAAADWLSRDSANRYRFVSSDPVTHLKDIVDQLRRHEGPLSAFIADRVNVHSQRRATFEELAKRWTLDLTVDAQADEVVRRLARMQFVTLDRSEYEENRIRRSVASQLTGDHETATRLIEAYLESNLAKIVTPSGLLLYLVKHDVHPRDSSKDPTLPSAVESLRRDFVQPLKDRLIHNQSIVRAQTRSVLEAIGKPQAPRVVLVHGRPGFGKSSVLLSLCEELQARGVPLLPISFAMYPPEGSLHEYGRTLNLGVMPAVALRGVSGNEKAILILDQLDSLRTTTAKSPNAWMLCQKIVGTAITDTGIVVVIACRTFDLENDPNIRRWRDDLERKYPGGVVQIEVGLLDAADVQAVVKASGVDYSGLSPRLKSLLAHPNTLDMWTRLVAHGHTGQTFSTTTQVISKLVEVLRNEALQTAGVSEADVTDVLERAREHMESAGALKVPRSALPNRPAAIGAVCSVGLMVSSGASFAFPHQSYFDHLVARDALQNAGSSTEEMIAWVKSDQSLMRRDQLRQLLLLLRDEQPDLFVRMVETLLHDGEVRFHLKRLVLGLLRESVPPASGELNLVVRLMENQEWRDHVYSLVLFESVGWFDALYMSRHLEKWLEEGHPLRNDALHLMRMTMRSRPNQIDALVARLKQSSTWNEDMDRVASYHPEDDSPLIAEYRERQMMMGAMTASDIWLGWLAEKAPDRFTRFVDAHMRGLLRRVLQSRTTDEAVEVFRVSMDPEKFAEALGRDPYRSWTQLTRLLKLAERIERLLHPDKQETGRTFYWRNAALKAANAFLQPLASLCAVAMARQDRDLLKQVLGQRLSRTTTMAVIRALPDMPPEAADLAIEWLVTHPCRLSLRDSYQASPYELACRVIAKHAPLCGDVARQRLEDLLLSYHPSREKQLYEAQMSDRKSGRWGFEQEGRYIVYPNPWGEAQYRLLNAIPTETKSAKVHERLKVWNGKFRGAYDEEAEGRGPSVRDVGSPIPQDRVHLVSDREWRRIVCTAWPQDGSRKRRYANRVTEFSHGVFGRDFAMAARKDPPRFLRLALSLPKEAAPDYVAGLFSVLSNTEVSLEGCDHGDLEKLIARVAATGDDDSLREACQFLQHHPKDHWGEAIWQLLGSAAQSPNPDNAAYMDRRTEEEFKDRDFETISINCVRGIAASAIAKMIWRDPTRIGRASEIVDTLVVDPHPAVRMAAAEIAAAVYEADQTMGMDILRRVTEHEDDRVLKGHILNQIFNHVRWSKRGSMAAVFERMVKSGYQDVAEMGARWITAEWHQFGHHKALYQECKAGAQAHRKGVAASLVSLLDDRYSNLAAIESDFVSMCSESDPEVRRLTSEAFRQDAVLLGAIGPRLSQSVVQTPAFEDIAEILIMSLEHRAVDVFAYRSAILGAAERIAGELAPESRNLGSRMGMIGRNLAPLLFKLYDGATKAGDSLLAEQCLDRWDAMLEARVGDAEKHLESYET